jgi:DNA-binding PadR family transcriptional regulator
MVYPALTYLDEVGYATVEADGSKKLYRISDAGLAKLNENRAFVDAVLAQLAHVGSKMDRVRQAFAGDEPGDSAHAAVDAARHELRAALIAKLNASPSADELQRISDVLKRATDELRRKK